MKKRIGPREASVLAYVQMRDLRIVQTEDLVGPLNLSPKQVRETLSRMNQAGLIARIRPGLYLFPPRLPAGGSWSPGEILALNTLMADRKATYQICGPNAFSRYGFADQVPNRLYAYNNRLTGTRRISAVQLELIKVSSHRLGETECFRTKEGQEAVYSNRVRTLVDAVYDWSRFNTLPRAYGWIRAELSSGGVSEADLVRVTIRFGNKGTIRRMGTLLEAIRVSDSLLDELEAALPQTTATIPWVPGYPKRGRLAGRWGVIINDQV